MKVVIDYSYGRYYFTRLDFLGKDCEVVPEEIHEVDAQTVELWSAINRLSEMMQGQLKKLYNDKVERRGDHTRNAIQRLRK